VSSRQTIRGQTTPQQSLEEGLVDGGGGWSSGLLGGWWNAGNFDKNSSLGGSSWVRSLFNVLVAPVESRPPFLRRPHNMHDCGSVV